MVVVSVEVTSVEAEATSAVEALEEVAVEVESGSAERTSQVELRTLLAQDPASLHLGIHHMGGPFIPFQQAVR